MAPNKMFLSVFLGVLVGGISTLLIPLLMRSVQVRDNESELLQTGNTVLLGFEITNPKFALMFVIGMLLVILLRLVSSIILMQAAIDIAAGLRSEIYDLLKNTSVLTVEKFGYSKIISVLNTDIANVIGIGQAMPILLMQIAMMLCFMSFLAYIDFGVFAFTLSLVIFGFVSNLFLRRFSQRQLSISREYVDELQESVGGLVYGLKEIKLNTKKCKDYFDNTLLFNNKNYTRTQKNGFAIANLIGSYGRLLYYISLGVAAFIFGSFSSISPDDIVLIIVILLLLEGPVMTLTGFVVQFANASVSIKRFDLLKRQLIEEKVSHVPIPIEEWAAVKHTQIRFIYDNEPEETSDNFVLGPLDFTIRRGEITFIVGGNGSGKSTLGKLITLHYTPESGEICFGNKKADEDSIYSLRQEISAVFSDFFLFNRLLGVNDLADLDVKVREYLIQMQLADKVSYANGKFSTISSLSDGQKRRLALIVSLIEDKNLYLFDEWAADQDPQFRKLFYLQILPDLRSKGKAVVVITHDERYFDIADQIFLLENGRILTKDEVPLNIGNRASHYSNLI